jgi:hypothetical protein
MARPRRFERPTSTSGGWRSIQLSYGRIRGEILSEIDLVGYSSHQTSRTERFNKPTNMELYIVGRTSIT